MALTTSGDESASPTPSKPSSVRRRTSTESWLLAVLAWTLGMRRIWQTTEVIFIGGQLNTGIGEIATSESVRRTQFGLKTASRIRPRSGCGGGDVQKPGFFRGE